MDIWQQMQLGKFLSPEDAQMYDPMIQMLAKGGSTPAGERGATSTQREIARAQKSRGPVNRSGGSRGVMPSSQSGLPTPEMQLVQMLAGAGQTGPASAMGRALGFSADGSITGQRRHSVMMDRAFAASDPNSSMDWDSGAMMGAASQRRRVQTQPGARVGFGDSISGRPTGKEWDTTENDEYTRRQRELKYRDQDADFEDRRTRELLQMIMGAGNMNEREVTEGDQYVNSAGAWKRMPTREVRTKSISPLDILRMLGR